MRMRSRVVRGEVASNIVHEVAVSYRCSRIAQLPRQKVSKRSMFPAVRKMLERGFARCRRSNERILQGGIVGCIAQASRDDGIRRKLVRRLALVGRNAANADTAHQGPRMATIEDKRDRKSTRLNSSHVAISYAVFCLKKKKKTK